MDKLIKASLGVMISGIVFSIQNKMNVADFANYDFRVLGNTEDKADFPPFIPIWDNVGA